MLCVRYKKQFALSAASFTGFDILEVEVVGTHQELECNLRLYRELRDTDRRSIIFQFIVTVLDCFLQDGRLDLREGNLALICLSKSTLEHRSDGPRDTRHLPRHKELMALSTKVIMYRRQEGRAQGEQG